MAVYFTFQFVGFLSPFDWVEGLNYGLKVGPSFVFTGILLILTLIDCKYFYLNPLQTNIIVNNEEGTQSVHKMDKSSLLEVSKNDLDLLERSMSVDNRLTQLTQL